MRRLFNTADENGIILCYCGKPATVEINTPSGIVYNCKECIRIQEEVRTRMFIDSMAQISWGKYIEKENDNVANT